MDDRTGGVSRRKTTRKSAAGLGDPEAEQRTQELEAEIQETRVELAETIDAIQEKLRPSNLVADATERVRTATTEKVKSMADTAGETAQNVMHSTRETAYDLVEGARQNPIPALMIGAGVAWLLIDRGRRYDEGPYIPGESRSWASDTPASAMYEGSNDYDRSSSIQTSAADAAARARYGARRVQSQFQRLLYDNPLLVGAAAVLVGAAVGAALPETERENELMGETRDNLVERAQQITREAVDTVGDVARDSGRDFRTSSQH